MEAAADKKADSAEKPKSKGWEPLRFDRGVKPEEAVADKKAKNTDKPKSKPWVPFKFDKSPEQKKLIQANPEPKAGGWKPLSFGGQKTSKGASAADEARKPGLNTEVVEVNPNAAAQANLNLETAAPEKASEEITKNPEPKAEPAVSVPDNKDEASQAPARDTEDLIEKSE